MPGIYDKLISTKYIYIHLRSLQVWKGKTSAIRTLKARAHALLNFPFYLKFKCSCEMVHLQEIIRPDS